MLEEHASTPFQGTRANSSTLPSHCRRCRWIPNVFQIGDAFCHSQMLAAQAGTRLFERCTLATIKPTICSSGTVLARRFLTERVTRACIQNISVNPEVACGRNKRIRIATFTVASQPDEPSSELLDHPSVRCFSSKRFLVSAFSCQSRYVTISQRQLTPAKELRLKLLFVYRLDG